MSVTCPVKSPVAIHSSVVPTRRSSTTFVRAVPAATFAESRSIEAPAGWPVNPADVPSLRISRFAVFVVTSSTMTAM